MTALGFTAALAVGVAWVVRLNLRRSLRRQEARARLLGGVLEGPGRAKRGR